MRAACGRSITENCLVNTLAVVETDHKQVKNFEKQWKRIVSKDKTSESKGGKLDDFKKPLERLVEAGGGDGSNLSCQGSTNSPGGLRIKNLTSVLTNCSKDIEDACNESNKPLINMAKVERCNAMIAKFEEISKGCLAVPILHFFLYCPKNTYFEKAF